MPRARRALAPALFLVLGLGVTAAPGGAPSRPDDGPVIDVLVVYTPGARAYVGSAGAVADEVAGFIDVTNAALGGSGAATRVRLVHARELPSAAGVESLGPLVAPDDGELDGVHALRDAYAADVVILMDAYQGGLAETLAALEPGSEANAFALVGLLSWPIQMPRELGRLLGCSRAEEDDDDWWGWSPPPLFPFSRGHRFVGDSGTPWRTIMTDGGGDLIAHYSNPDVLFDGQPTGTPEANNAATIELTAPHVAAYRDADETCVAIGLPGDAPDCDGNGVPDRCDVARGALPDGNGNGIPDLCDLRGDADGDGVVTATDLQLVLGAWGPCDRAAPCPGDLDGDGARGVLDLLAVLDGWGARITGACCHDGGACVVVDELACAATGGAWGGASSDCGAVVPVCEPPEGACCTPDGGCVELVGADCDLIDGSAWAGPLSTCAGGLCVTGACCRTDGCVPRPVIACWSRFWAGPGTGCATFDCDLDPCCYEDGSCLVSTEWHCAETGGAWLRDRACSACPIGRACCFDDDGCAVLTADACAAAGGTWLADAPLCTSAAGCPGPACCLDDGACVELPERACLDAGGLWLGVAALCENAPCEPGSACCFADDGSCDVLTADACEAAGGVRVIAESCAAGACPAPPICCVPAGACAELPEPDCLDAGGAWLGFGASCDQCAPACCLGVSGGDCLTLPERDCLQIGGTWLSDEGCTASLACPYDGACCLSGGACAEVAEFECLEMDGAWLGLDPTCAERGCPPAPPNEACAGAAPITDGVHAFDTTYAGTDGLSSCGEIRFDVWFRYTTPCLGTLSVGTCGTGFDTAIAVHPDDCSVVFPVACNDDACGAQSEVTLFVPPGKTFRIRVGSPSGERGPGLLSVTCTPLEP